MNIDGFRAHTTIAVSKAHRENYEELLEKKGLRVTYERKKIFDEIFKLRRHFDADVLYGILKAKGYRISRDTVYRTLPLLLESGVIQKSAGGNKREYFENTRQKGHHDHLICIECGTIVEFKNAELEILQEAICRRYGYGLTFHDHRLFGKCAKCQRAGKNK